MHNDHIALPYTAQASKPAVDDIPFDIIIDEAEWAARVTGEPEDDHVANADGRGASARLCAKCHGIEFDDGDRNYEGTRNVAVLSENLTHCSTCTDCVIHPRCGKTVGDASGLCPHCAFLENEKLVRASREDDLLPVTLSHASEDLKRGLELLKKETDSAKRAAVQETLKEIWEAALIGSVENRDEIVRMRTASSVAA